MDARGLGRGRGARAPRRGGERRTGGARRPTCCSTCSIASRSRRRAASSTTSYWIDEPAAPTTIAAGDAPALRANRDRIERFAAGAARPGPRATRRRSGGRPPRCAQEQGLMGGLGAQPPFPLGLHRHASNAIVVSPEFSATRPSDPARRPADRARRAELLLGGRPPRRRLRGRGRDRAGGARRADRARPELRHDAHLRASTTRSTPTSRSSIPPIPGATASGDGGSPSSAAWRRSRSRARATSPSRCCAASTARSSSSIATAGVAFSRRAAFRGHELESAAAVLNLGRVRSLRDFRRLADRMSMSFNFHYADDAGNIAYFHRGAPAPPPAAHRSAPAARRQRHDGMARHRSAPHACPPS